MEIVSLINMTEGKEENMSYLEAIGKPYEGELFRANHNRAGYDIVQLDDFIFKPLALTKVMTNVRFPLGLGNYFALLTLRSSYQSSGLTMPALGVIDSDYTDCIFYTLYNENIIPVTVKKGDRIAQLVFLPLQK